MARLGILYQQIDADLLVRIPVRGPLSRYTLRLTRPSTALYLHPQDSCALTQISCFICARQNHRRYLNTPCPSTPHWRLIKRSQALLDNILLRLSLKLAINADPLKKRKYPCGPTNRSCYLSYQIIDLSYKCNSSIIGRPECRLKGHRGCGQKKSALYRGFPIRKSYSRYHAGQQKANPWVTIFPLTDRLQAQKSVSTNRSQANALCLKQYPDTQVNYQRASSLKMAFRCFQPQLCLDFSCTGLLVLVRRDDRSTYHKTSVMRMRRC
jgi:hypothetical protein